jgi:preprotein translocase subunit SecF
VIGEDLQRKGIYATIASLVGIMAYIAFRFRFSFGVGAMVASIHDVLITLSFLTFAGYEISLNVIAAILTLVGYGVNDQIVIFDRVRENLRSHRRLPMKDVINMSVNQTLPRTVITAGTTALSVLSLFLFGGEVLEPFAFAMLVGIITSTYSTVFIASAIAVLLTQRRGGGAAAVSTTPAASGEPARQGQGRKQRRARAS